MKEIKFTRREIAALLWALEITDGALAGNDELEAFEKADLNRLEVIKERLRRALAAASLV